MQRVCTECQAHQALPAHQWLYILSYPPIKVVRSNLHLIKKAIYRSVQQHQPQRLEVPPARVLKWETSKELKTFLIVSDPCIIVFTCVYYYSLVQLINIIVSSHYKNSNCLRGYLLIIMCPYTMGRQPSLALESHLRVISSSSLVTWFASVENYVEYWEATLTKMKSFSCQ